MRRLNVRIRKVIEEIEKCDWILDPSLTDEDQQRRVFKHPDRRDRITIIGDLDEDLPPAAAGGIITNASDD
jgi:hypothetical protein